MSNVGIITFHRASNYGAVLQAYALQNVLSGMGCEAEIIDYRGEAVEEEHHPSKVLCRYKLPVAALKYLQRSAKFRGFERFRRNRLPLSEAVTNRDVCKLDGSYDLILAGSDQVWNDIFAGFDPVYRLDFVEKSRRCSYACSFGFDEFPDGSKPAYKRSLERFEVVSVREASAKDLVEGDLGLTARVDLDPTLLLSADEWKSISSLPAADADYILVYNIQEPIALLDAARKKSAETGLGIVFLNNGFRQDRDLRHVRYGSPEEFLGWFAGARYVYTNSFHGTVFSIIFEKEFTVECRTGYRYNNRSKALLDLVGLEGREMTETDTGDGPIDWYDVRMRLAAAREDSLGYLRDLCAGKEASLDE